MSAHTPGPWEAGEERGRVKLTVRPPGGSLVADVHPRSDPGITLANARLIAAAPDLLEAVRHLHDAIEVLVPDRALRSPVQRSLEIARAAIAKATGSGR